MKPFFLKAACKDYIWGGNRLREYGKESDKDRIAESWELSCHPDGESVIASGEYEGMTLKAFLEENPDALGVYCEKFDRFPVLIKLIDAKENLSLQVHPDNAYAMKQEHDWGKTELWYIIEAEPGAEIIYGFKDSITKEQFQFAIKNHSILNWVQHVPVKAGDVFYIPAGTVHAIGKGILLAEIQQSSNLTYRIYDYDRGRELHIDKALDVTRLTPAENPAPEEPVIRDGFTAQYLKRCPFFTVQKITASESSVGYYDSFRHLLILDGDAVIEIDGQEVPIKKGDSIFIPAGVFCPIRGKCTALKTFMSHTGNPADKNIRIKEHIIL
ncbi:MAG: class I mannose-6-phosphate isomerase [Oscillospiraceae bacterium]|nr:class I mannose-6-phosphate isomerase [Oscillospiraceae bacterium]